MTAASEITNRPNRRQRRVVAALSLPRIDPARLPQRVDRATAAAIITERYGPISPRTLETWPGPWVLMNGRATVATADLLAEADRRFRSATAIRA